MTRASSYRGIQMETELRSLQSLLYRLITAPEGPGERLRADPGLSTTALDHIIRGDERLGAAERVQIYATAYFHRLLDCLKEDFPATLAVLGADDFHQLVADYLAAHPPTEPSIYYAGRFLPGFLGTHRFARRWPFAEDLARLERTTIEVFHGPAARPLKPDAMRALAPEQWPTLELVTHPALRILDCRWKVSDVLRAVNAGERWREPPEADTSVLVWRQETEVYFGELDRPERRALELARQPVTFARICETIARTTRTADPVQEIGRLFERWLADGILVSRPA